MDQNSLFNKDTRILAIDDSPFSKKDSKTFLVCLIIRRDLYIESIVKREIEVDGMDVSNRLIDIIKEKGEGISIILTKGLTFGGFNILDVERVFEYSNIPIINFMDHEPDMIAIKEALKLHFNDWKDRYKLLSKRFVKVDDAFIQSVGIKTGTAKKFIDKVTFNGKIPEPLRLVDLIAGIL